MYIHNNTPYHFRVCQKREAYSAVSVCNYSMRYDAAWRVAWWQEVTSRCVMRVMRLCTTGTMPFFGTSLLSLLSRQVVGHRQGVGFFTVFVLIINVFVPSNGTAVIWCWCTAGGNNTTCSSTVYKKIKQIGDRNAIWIGWWGRDVRALLKSSLSAKIDLKLRSVFSILWIPNSWRRACRACNDLN